MEMPKITLDTIKDQEREVIKAKEDKSFKDQSDDLFKNILKKNSELVNFASATLESDKSEDYKAGYLSGFVTIYYLLEKELEKINVQEKTIIASGPVIIRDGKLLVNHDEKDDFYKLPGGTIKEGEDFEEACINATRRENNVGVKVIRPLSPMILWENPQTKEKMKIILIHYEGELENEEELKPMEPTKEVKWLDIEEIKSGEHKVGPNIKFLIEKGEIK